MQTWVKRGAISGTVVALTLAMMTLVAVSESQAEGLNYERLAGPSGVETSLAVAKHTWGTNWPVVYVAANRNPVDALPAATIGDGPVVLTDGKQLNLGGVKPGHIVILGGPGAVPESIAQQARQTCGAENVERLAGSDRNATARAIADRWFSVNGPTNRMYLTKNAGSGSPDAVAGSVLRDAPIITYTNEASISAAQQFVAMRMPADQPAGAELVALGGSGAVPDAVLQTVANGAATQRFAGANRYLTAFEIAKFAATDPARKVAYVASGTALKDAMVAGASKDGFILLTPPGGAGTFQQIVSMGANNIVFIGGEGVLPQSTVAMAAGIGLGADGPGNPHYITNNVGFQLEGLIRILSAEELIQMENLKNVPELSEVFAGTEYAVLILDEPAVFDISYASDTGPGAPTVPRETDIVLLADTSDPKAVMESWRGYDGVRASVTFKPYSLFWPGDVSLPTTGAHSTGAYIDHGKG
ncbi:cell wall-binding repeat-containing protein [uncultured Mobiluncus sp.]|uniref:cell wall-binding repeat-containing protein n=1 Tax=uncultured Mobiluncus sp. TaxID=293425 RepID=UPI0027D9457C|nr:cell wall-binding repeat-containing protein [uncultured Mobiluncus sp.]